MKSRLIAAALLAATATPAAAEFSPEAKAFIQSTIAANGFNCPVVKTISGEGADAYGDVFKVRCGVPGDWQRIAYRVTLTPGDDVIVAPWE